MPDIQSDKRLKRVPGILHSIQRELDGLRQRQGGLKENAF